MLPSWLKTTNDTHDPISSMLAKEEVLFRKRSVSTLLPPLPSSSPCLPGVCRDP